MMKAHITRRAAIALALTSIGLPVQAGSLNPAQKDEVRALIRDYLRDNPEAVGDALQALQQKQEAQLRECQRSALPALRERLESSPDSPVVGNPKGDVTLVDFSDYNCPYCKRMYPMVDDIVSKDGNVRVVVKELPILGPESLHAARFALAAKRQGKYQAFRSALMTLGGRPGEAAVLDVAKRVGLDIDQLKKDAALPEVEREIRDNQELANMLGIGGTPAYVVGNDLVPGAVGRQVLVDKIAAARRARKGP